MADSSLVDISSTPNTDHECPSPSFSRFNDLPAEIRFAIWELASLQPRLVMFRLNPLKATYDEWKRCLKESEAEIDYPVESTDSDLGDVDIDIGRTGFESIASLPDLSLGPIASSEMAIDDPFEYLVPQYPIDLPDNPTFTDANKFLHPSFSMLGPKCESRIPPVLLACRESNKSTSHDFTRTFSNGATMPETYFNFNRDILYLNYFEMLSGTVQFFRLSDYLDYVNPKELHNIKNLAVLIDRDLSQAEREVCLGDLLGGFFTVKNLFIILHHYKNGISDSSSLSLMDPIDMKETLVLYENYNPHLWNWQLPGSVSLERDSAKLNADQLRRCITWNLGDHWDPHGLANVLPKIEYKIVVSSDYLQDFESAREHCQEVIDQHSKTLIDSSSQE